jgi:hypothetical protein
MSSARTRAHVPRVYLTTAAVALATLLSGCGTSGEQLSAAFVTPEGSQYEFYDCNQLVAQIRASDNAALELRDRISKSGQLASVIGGYETDYAIQRGNAIAARNAARKKNCEIQADSARK